MLMPDVVDADTATIKAIFAARQYPGDHLGVFTFPSCRSAVLTVGGDVEDGLIVDRQFSLNLKCFVQHFFAAGKVLASGKFRKRPITCVEHIGGMGKFSHEQYLLA
jgi:hypothetical protein